MFESMKLEDIDIAKDGFKFKVSVVDFLFDDGKTFILAIGSSDDDKKKDKINKLIIREYYVEKDTGPEKNEQPEQNEEQPEQEQQQPPTEYKLGDIICKEDLYKGETIDFSSRLYLYYKGEEPSQEGLDDKAAKKYQKGKVFFYQICDNNVKFMQVNLSKESNEDYYVQEVMDDSNEILIKSKSISLDCGKEGYKKELQLVIFEDLDLENDEPTAKMEKWFENLMVLCVFK